MKKYKFETAMETKNFTTTKRNIYFTKQIAERFKSWTMWFLGCTVHHWDENPCNNHPLNLGCMTASEHTRLHMTGKKHSDETKNKRSIALKGIPLSEETKIKFRKPKKTSINMCKPKSDEHKENIKLSWVKRKLNKISP